MSPTIRIDDDVYEVLKAQAEPFVDTPNSVLRRLFKLDATEPAQDVDIVESDSRSHPLLASVPTAPAPKPTTPTSQRRGKKPSTTKRHRAPAGTLLPEARYEMPLLRTLVELGGSAQSRQIIDLVGEKLKGDLTEVDKEMLSSGVIRWQNRVQFVRLGLIKQGLMAKDAPRGVWAISEAGRIVVSQHESGVA